MTEEKQNLFAPRYIVSQFNLDEIVIPHGITDIGDYALYNCNTLKSVEFPSGGLKSIGLGAFAGCGKLKKIIIPENASVGVLTIKDYAFAACVNLEMVYLGGGIKSIGNYTFGKCLKLKTLAISLLTIDRIEKNAFYNCNKSLKIIFSDILNKFNPKDITKLENYPWGLPKDSISLWHPGDKITSEEDEYNKKMEEIERKFIRDFKGISSIREETKDNLKFNESLIKIWKEKIQKNMLGC